MELEQQRPGGSEEDVAAVTRAALDYLKGYTEGDPERHARAYHPECIKRRFRVDEESGATEQVVLSPQTMVEYAASGRSVHEDCEADVFVDAIYDDIASVRVYSCNWVDFLHVVKARGEWRLLHVTWQNRAAA